MGNTFGVVKAAVNTIEERVAMVLGIAQSRPVMVQVPTMVNLAPVQGTGPECPAPDDGEDCDFNMCVNEVVGAEILSPGPPLGDEQAVDFRVPAPIAFHMHVSKKLMSKVRGPTMRARKRSKLAGKLEKFIGKAIHDVNEYLGGSWFDVALEYENMKASDLPFHVRAITVISHVPGFDFVSALFGLTTDELVANVENLKAGKKLSLRNHTLAICTTVGSLFRKQPTFVRETALPVPMSVTIDHPVLVEQIKSVKEHYESKILAHSADVFVDGKFIPHSPPTTVVGGCLVLKEDPLDCQASYVPPIAFPDAGIVYPPENQVVSDKSISIIPGEKPAVSVVVPQPKSEPVPLVVENGKKKPIKGMEPEVFFSPVTQLMSERDKIVDGLEKFGHIDHRPCLEDTQSTDWFQWGVNRHKHPYLYYCFLLSCEKKLLSDQFLVAKGMKHTMWKVASKHAKDIELPMARELGLTEWDYTRHMYFVSGMVHRPTVEAMLIKLTPKMLSFYSHFTVAGNRRFTRPEVVFWFNKYMMAQVATELSSNEKYQSKDYALTIDAVLTTFHRRFNHAEPIISSVCHDVMDIDKDDDEQWAKLNGFGHLLEFAFVYRDACLGVNVLSGPTQSKGILSQPK